MVLFCKIACAATTVMLLVFLMQSRFTMSKTAVWKQALCYLGCCAFLLLEFHWVIPVAVSALSAVFLSGQLGNAHPVDALRFGLLVGLLQLAASGIPFLLLHFFPEINEMNTLLVRHIAFYALTVCAVFLTPDWHAVSFPLLSLIPIWLVSLLLWAESIRAKEYAGIEIIEFLHCLWIIYSGICLFPVHKKMNKALQHAADQRQISIQQALQEEYYWQLQQKQTQTRALWHDLNKYLRAAKAETAPSEALEKLQSMLDEATAIVDVGNATVNVILNEYNQYAKCFGIQLRLKVQIPEKLGISAADLYILIGNTMDNAIEACRILPQSQRLIDLTLRTQQDILYYRLANPHDPQKRKAPYDPMRGHGLDNARRCVEQYNGQLLTQQDHGFFVVTAHMNQPPNSEA